MNISIPEFNELSLQEDKYNNKETTEVDKFRNDLDKIYCLGCPMSCSVKSIFDDYAKHGSSFGLPGRAIPSAFEILKDYTFKFDMLLYSFVIHQQVEYFSQRWEFLKKKFNL
jgi:hypothetical protein